MKKISLMLVPMILFLATEALASWLTNPAVVQPLYYSDNNRDLAEKFGYDATKLLNHWVDYGIRDGRPSSPVFDVRYYLQHNPDVASAVGRESYAKATEHWFKSGRKEGRPSHPRFHVKKYLELNKDVAREYGQTNYIEAINHYLRTGYKEGRRAI